MLRYIGQRVAGMIPLFLGATAVCFLILHLAPGDPVVVNPGMNARIDPTIAQQFREMYGLDRPLPEQYLSWMRRVVTLDFGLSLSNDRRPVMEKIGNAIPITLGLNIASLLLILFFSLVVGLVSALRRGTALDQALTVTAYLGFAAPDFWIALLLQLLFGVALGWLPVSGIQTYGIEDAPGLTRLTDLARHLALPLFVMTFGSIAAMSRYMRSSMLEILGEDYLRTARAKGLPVRTVILRHGLRNALLPIITILGLSVPGLIGGTVILENVFAIPGMGRLYFESAMARDYSTLMGILVLGIILTLLGNLLADIFYAVADPRAKQSLSIGD